MLPRRRRTPRDPHRPRTPPERPSPGDRARRGRARRGRPDRAAGRPRPDRRRERVPVALLVRQRTARHVRTAGADPGRPAAAEGDRRRAGRRGARGLGSRVPGRVPQPPRRPLPAGRGGGRRARCDDRRRLRPDGSARAHGSDRRLHRRARRRRAGVRARAFEPRGPGHDQPRPRRRRRRLVPDRGPDVPAAAAFRDPPPGLHVDPRAARDDRLGRRSPRAPIGRGRGGDAAGPFVASST